MAFTVILGGIEMPTYKVLIFYLYLFPDP